MRPYRSHLQSRAVNLRGAAADAEVWPFLLLEAVFFVGCDTFIKTHFSTLGRCLLIFYAVITLIIMDSLTAASGLPRVILLRYRPLSQA